MPNPVTATVTGPGAVDLRHPGLADPAVRVVVIRTDAGESALRLAVHRCRHHEARRPVDKQEILERVAFYRDAPPSLRSSMLRTARYRKLAPGEALFTEGEPASHVAALGSGSIRVFRAGATGRQITLYHVRPQESSLVGMLSVLLGRPLIGRDLAAIVRLP